MGMYDKEPQFEDHFNVGDRMAVVALEYVGEIGTRFGPAHKSRITVTTRETYPKTAVFSVLGAGFANLAQRAAPGDFPHVAEFVTVKLDEKRTVKRLARVDVDPKAWVEGNDGPPVDISELTPQAASDPQVTTDDVAPF